jgi:hypothetical protein
MGLDCLEIRRFLYQPVDVCSINSPGIFDNVDHAFHEFDYYVSKVLARNDRCFAKIKLSMR